MTKRVYIKPETETVIVRLFNSVLDTVGTETGSYGADGGDMEARGQSFFDEEEEEDGLWTRNTSNVTNKLWLE